MPEPITARQAAEKLGIPEGNLRQLINLGKLPSARRVGKIWVVDLEDVEKLQIEKPEHLPPPQTQINTPLVDGLTDDDKKALTVVGIILGLTLLFGFFGGFGGFFLLFVIVTVTIVIIERKEMNNDARWFDVLGSVAKRVNKVLQLQELLTGGLAWETKQGLIVLGIGLGLTVIFGLNQKYPGIAIYFYAAGLIYFYMKYMKEQIEWPEVWGSEAKKKKIEPAIKEQWLTADQTAELLGIPDHEVEAMIEQMQFPSTIVLNNMWMVSTVDLREKGVPAEKIETYLESVRTVEIEVKKERSEKKRVLPVPRKRESYANPAASKYERAPREDKKDVDRDRRLMMLWLAGAGLCMLAVLALWLIY